MDNTPSPSHSARSAGDTPRIGVVIPYYNAAPTLARALESILVRPGHDVDVVCVNDGSTDESEAIVTRYDVRQVSMIRRSGAAVARNTGAAATDAPILFFLDADVEVLPDAIDRCLATFDAPDAPDAVFGAYTPEPHAGNFASWYKNLVHHYTHVTSKNKARSFWCGCGAIRADVFHELGGFDQSYEATSVEDIELGYRLTANGGTIRLDPSMQVRHGKRYGFFSLLKSDFWDRAVPWTLLMARKNVFYSDLNLRASNVVSALLLVLAGPLAIVALERMGVATAWFAPPVLAAIYYILNRELFALAGVRGGWYRLAFVAMHTLFYLYSVVGFALGLALYAVEKIRGRPVRV